MYKLYQSNDLSTFINIKSIKFQAKGLFEDSPLIIVQNRQMAEWLKLKITGLEGICCNLEFEFPDNAIRRLLAGFSSAKDYLETKKILFMDDLKVIIYKTLEEIFDQSDIPEFETLKIYCKGGGSEKEIISKRLYQLSDSIAGLFYYYGMNCRALISLWEEEKLEGSHPEEVWQSMLWRMLFTEKYGHIGQVLDLIQENKESYSGSIKNLILFGSSFLSESAFGFFDYLSKDIDVDHFLLTPSKRMVVGSEGYTNCILLEEWGKILNGFCETAASSDLEVTAEFQKNNQDTALGQIKEIFLEDLASPTKAERTKLILDSSFSIYACAGMKREVEVLHDQILGDLDCNPDLQLTDICVLAPDIDAYTPYIEAVFSSDKKEFSLPRNIMDLGFGSQSAYILGFLKLLDLYDSRLSRDDLFGFIDNPCVAARFGISEEDRSLWLDFCSQTNTFWAYDEAYKRRKGLGVSGINTWEEAFTRFLAGNCFGRDPENTKQDPVTLTGKSEIFVFPAGRKAARESLGRLMKVVRGLYADFSIIEGHSMSLDSWVFLLECFMESYLKVRRDNQEDERSRRRLKDSFKRILNLSKDLGQFKDFKDPEFDYGFLRNLLREFISQKVLHRGNYLTGGITFSSIKPLRAIPFKHIYILGLNENSFPSKEIFLNYDLRELLPDSIDLSRRSTDYFAFLETIVSASDRLCIFYQGMDPVSGEEKQASSVVTTLLELLEQYFTANIPDLSEENGNQGLLNFSDSPSVDLQDFLVSKQTVKAYHFSNFTGENLSYNQEAYNMAVSFYCEEKRKPKACLCVKKAETPLLLNIAELIAFLRDPLRLFCEKTMGLYLREEDLLEKETEEPIEPGFFDKWRAYQEWLEVEEFPLDDFFKKSRGMGLLTDSSLGSHFKESFSEGFNQFIGNFNDYFSDKNLVYYNFRLLEPAGNPELNDVSPLVLENNWQLSGPLKQIKGDGEGHYYHVFPCFSSDIKTSRFLTTFVYSLVLSAHKDIPFASITAVPIGNKIYKPQTFSPLPGQSLNLLSGLFDAFSENLKKTAPIYPKILDALKVNELKELHPSFCRNIEQKGVESPYLNLLGGQIGWNMELPWVHFLLDEFYPCLLGGGKKNV